MIASRQSSAARHRWSSVLATYRITIFDLHAAPTLSNLCPTNLSNHQQIICESSKYMLPLHHRTSVLPTYQNTRNTVAQSSSYTPQFYIRKSSPQPHSLKLRLVYALRVHTNITKQDITHQYNDTRVEGIRAWHSLYNTMLPEVKEDYQTTNNSNTNVKVLMIELPWNQRQNRSRSDLAVRCAKIYKKIHFPNRSECSGTIVSPSLLL